MAVHTMCVSMTSTVAKSAAAASAACTVPLSLRERCSEKTCSYAAVASA